jgi:Family of unknown function (DUF6349)
MTAVSVQLDLFAGTGGGAGPVTPVPAHQIILGWRVREDHHNGGRRDVAHHAWCKTCRRQVSGDLERENDAVEAGMDHAWPGWRTLPVVAERPHHGKPEIRRWLVTVTAAYPPRWVTAGGPVRNARPLYATRSYFDTDLSIWDIGVPARAAS